MADKNGIKHQVSGISLLDTGYFLDDCHFVILVARESYSSQHGSYFPKEAI